MFGKEKIPEEMKRKMRVVSLFTLGMGNFTFASSPKAPMNIVLIMADDFGYECIGANGSEYHTPNVDRLAEQGIRFTNCHANPLSTPSRVQLMTGKYNVKNYVSFGCLDRKEKSFGNLLAEAGYATCIAGKWQLGKEVDSPQYFGFQASCLWQHREGATDSGGNDTRYTAPMVDVNGELKEYSAGSFGPDVYSDFIIDFIRKHHSDPFFVYYPMCLTHCPFVSTPASKKWEAVRSSTYKGNAVHFPDMVEYTDKMVGKIVDELERLGLMDNTLIVFTGDNGTDSPIVTLLDGKPYPGGKGKTLDSGTHVPLIVRRPHGLVGVNHNLIDFTDFLPTLCEAANVSFEHIPELDGKSFYPQLIGQSSQPREWVYCWYAPRKVYDEAAQVFARDESYKLYRDGRFYEVRNDLEEQYPILEADMTIEQKTAYHKLRKVIVRYESYAEKRKLQ